MEWKWNGMEMEWKWNGMESKNIAVARPPVKPPGIEPANDPAFAHVT